MEWVGSQNRIGGFFSIFPIILKDFGAFNPQES